MPAHKQSIPNRSRSGSGDNSTKGANLSNLALVTSARDQAGIASPGPSQNSIRASIGCPGEGTTEPKQNGREHGRRRAPTTNRPGEPSKVPERLLYLSEFESRPPS